MIGVVSVIIGGDVSPLVDELTVNQHLFEQNMWIRTTVLVQLINEVAWTVIGVVLTTSKRLNANIFVLIHPSPEIKTNSNVLEICL